MSNIYLGASPTPSVFEGREEGGYGYSVGRGGLHHPLPDPRTTPLPPYRSNTSTPLPAPSTPLPYPEGTYSAGQVGVRPNLPRNQVIIY